jgi:anti-sigma factor RsiW
MTHDHGCAEFVELTTAFLDGAMDERAERRFLEHLVACPGCERHLEQLSRTVQVLGQLPRERLSVDAEQRLLGVFRSWRDDLQR